MSARGPAASPEERSRPEGRGGAVPAPLAEYLRRLDVVSRALPFTDRTALRARVWQDLAVHAGPAPSEEHLIRALDRLGPPEDLVRTQGGDDDPLVVHLLGLSLLTLGVTGAVGLVRVWRSAAWTVRDGAVATGFVTAGALLLPLLTGVHPVLGALFGGFGLGAPVAGVVLGAVLLLRRRGRRGSTPPPPEGGGEPPPAGGVAPDTAHETSERWVPATAGTARPRSTRGRGDAAADPHSKESS